MKKNLLSVLAILLSLALVCSACSKKSNTASSNQVSDTVTSAPEDNTQEQTSNDVTSVPDVTEAPVADAQDDSSDDTTDSSTDANITDESDDEIIDDTVLEGNEEYFTSLGDIVGEWSSDYVDRSLYFFESQTFAFIYADTDRSVIRADGSYEFVDKNLVVLSFYDYSDYEGNMYLYVKNYDTMTTDEGENFIRFGVYDQSDYIDNSNDEYGVVSTDGVISFTWFGTEKPEDLSFFIYDENDALIDAYSRSEARSDGAMTTFFVIRAGVNPSRIEIMGTELETVNTIMSDVTMNIDLTHGTGEETDHYSISLDSLADCYVRSYTGAWYYNIPVHWYEMYLSEAQAG